MARTASTPEQVTKTKMYFLEGMLQGLFTHRLNTSAQERLEALAAKIGFAPGLWIKDPNHQAKVARMLNFVTKGNFNAVT
jgi:hypothetical protein